jgi:hypothetical protein
MARKLFISGGVGIGLVAAVVVVGVSLASASSRSAHRVWGAPTSMVHFSKAAASSSDATIVVVSRHAQETFIDEPPSGLSQGDEDTLSSPLYSRAGARVGHLDVRGAFTAVFQNTHTAREQVVFTATLKAGAITATGVVTASDQSNGFSAAVTGGTGAYQKTDGWVRVTFVSATTAVLAYHLTD